MNKSYNDENLFDNMREFDILDDENQVLRNKLSQKMKEIEEL